MVPSMPPENLSLTLHWCGRKKTLESLRSAAIRTRVHKTKRQRQWLIVRDNQLDRDVTRRVEEYWALQICCQRTTALADDAQHIQLILGMKVQ